MKAYQKLSRLWSTTHFNQAELTSYAEDYISDEVRRGIAVLGFLSLILLGSAAGLYAWLGFGTAYVYTFSMLALLALHVTISTRVVKKTEMLYMLGMTLLVIAGTAFVLLAHKTGAFSAALLSSTMLLFMVVPLVPWGVREATVVVTLVYLVFTLSTLSVEGRFGTEVIWLLQFLMLGSAIITLTVVARNVAIRRHDIKARFELENAHREMQLLSYKDPLTGAWNRRFLEKEFSRITQQYRDINHPFHLAVIDIDNFKELNDTYGHDLGDMVLQDLVQVILQHMQDDAHIIRMGGDEFMVLFSGPDPESVMQQVLDVLQTSRKLSYDGSSIPIYISVGLVSIKSQQHISLDVLYKEADMALYSAKSHSGKTNAQSHLVYRVLPVACAE